MNEILSIVMPVYNEEGAIGSVIDSWSSCLNGLGITYHLDVYNDGSRDNTHNVLQTLSGSGRYPQLRIHDKKNSGHGPTILQGYLESSDVDWVFQVDSDNELRPDEFADLWKNRGNYDFLIGIRVNRTGSFVRKIITTVARLAVSFFYGSGIKDVNCPYRLMRVSKVYNLFNSIPNSTFAPNIILSGLVVRTKLRIFQAPVNFYDRKTGEVSIKHWKLLKVAGKSLWQTLSLAITKRPDSTKVSDEFSILSSAKSVDEHSDCHTFKHPPSRSDGTTRPFVSKS